MKKLFSLVTLALMVTWGGVKADTKPTIDGITLPDAPTTTLDLSSQTDFEANENGWIVFYPKADGLDKKDYWTNTATNGNDRTWTVPSSAKAPFTDGTGKSCFALQVARTHALRFTGAECFSALGKSGGTSRYVQVSLYTYDGTTFTLVEKKSDKSNNVVEFYFDNLNTSTNYVAYFYGSDTNNADLIGVAIKAPSTKPAIAASDVTIKARKSGVEATQSIAITGTNLTGTELTATLSPAVDGLDVKLDANTISGGNIETTAQLSYTSTANVPRTTTTLTLSDGTTSKDVTITYLAKVEYSELQTINKATTWDFSKGISGGVQFSGEDQTTEYVYADIADFDNLTFTEEFDAKTLAFKGEYPFNGNSKQFAQNGTLHFKTTVPGTIKVKFSDTGTSASATAVKRYLVVNGAQTEYWASRANNGDNGYAEQLNVETDEIEVPAGDVTITGSSAIIVHYIIYTPSPTETAVVTEHGWATYVPTNDVKFEDNDAYIVTNVNTTTGAVTIENVTEVPANTAVLLKGKGEKTITFVESATLEKENLLKVCEGTETDKVAYVLAKDGDSAGFKQWTGEISALAGRAVLWLDDTQTARSFFALDSETTGIEIVAPAAAQDGAVYDLQGRRVAQPKNGLYIMNGKKVVVK